MHDLINRLDSLNRPRLLVRAARIGATDYRRDLHLPRALGISGVETPHVAIAQLLDLEHQINELRVLDAASYSVRRHIDVLIALVSEARLLRSARPNLTLIAAE